MTSNRNKLMFNCDACNEKFSSEQELYSHLNYGLYKCPFDCGKAYAHERELKICTRKFRI